MWKVRYALTATNLLARGRIRWPVYRMALRRWLIAVAGRHRGYILDPTFDDRG